VSRYIPVRFLRCLVLFLGVSSTAAAMETFVYFGSHSNQPGAGFSLARFDTDTGVLTKPSFLLEAKEPAFFIIHPNGRHLYTSNSGSPGGLSAYAIEPHTGALTLQNRQLAGGGDTSYISLDRTNRYALVANYDGGNIAAFALEPDGSIGDWTAFVQHTGKSVNPQRQAHAYAHAIVVSPDNRFALVPDLGVDKLFVYRFDEKTGKLAAHDPAFVEVPAGSGPRHVKFHPNGRWVYLINEMASTIIAYDWDAARGRLTKLQSVSTLPSDFKGNSTGAEVEVHPNGKFLYSSNRGHDSLAAFAIDAKDGRLSLIQHVPSGGRTPRNFAFDPTGKWLICTNHSSNNAVVFGVDGNTGLLTQKGDPVSVPSPFCERFLPVR
jgi:6-phosphogluconolactonase